MFVARAEIYTIEAVKDIQLDRDQATIRFRSGLTACFSLQHPDAKIFLYDAQWSLEFPQRPVGVLVDGSGQVVDLEIAHHVTVRWVRDCEEAPARILLAFWGFSPVCYLAKDHPEFDRIYTTLTAAQASDQRIWFAKRTHALESETETWFKILDVRPQPVVTPLPPSNGAGPAGAVQEPNAANVVSTP